MCIEVDQSGNQSDVCNVIDFSNVEKGSDLWLFSKVTDFGNDWSRLAVILSPDSNQKVWYKKVPQANQLVIYGEQEGEISYRLTAPRFDHEKWSNINSDEAAGMIVPDN